MAIGNECVAGVLTLADDIQSEPLRKAHRHVFHGVHGEIGFVGHQSGFQLLDEEALATNLGQGRVEQLVAATDHGNQTDLQSGVELFQARLDVFGLPQGQGALAGGDSQMSGHGILCQLQPA